MDGDGGNVRQLGRSGGEILPSISPDGRAVAFITAQRTGIWTQPTAGGEAKMLVDDPQAWNPRFSPDGTKLLYCTTRAVPNGPGRNVMVVIPAVGGTPLVEIGRPNADYWRWAPDQKSALFLKLEGDTNNLWRLPLDGKPAERMTSFKSTFIFDYALVDGGKTLVYSRGEGGDDAVLITNFE
jgi:Tol biopolymer transport system component